MKRFAIAAIAALSLAGPLATAAYADPPNRHDNRGRDNDRRDNDRGDNNRRDNDRRDNNWRDNDRRDNDRRDTRWDQNRHNGYSYNGRWYYGAPPAAYAHRSDFRPGYRAWRRGDRLPSHYRNQYRQVDWRREHMRAPPRGYHYVRDDNHGETLLVAIATGVILTAILSSQ